MDQPRSPPNQVIRANALIWGRVQKSDFRLWSDLRKLVLLLCSILAENAKHRSTACSSCDPQPWSWLSELHWWTSPAQEQGCHTLGASRRTACSTSPARPALTFCSVHQQQHCRELLHTCHRLTAQAKEKLPGRVRHTSTASPAAAQGLPRPSFIFMAREKQLSALGTSATFTGAQGW